MGISGKRNLLELRPRRLHSQEESDGGEVSVLVLRFGHGFMGRVMRCLTRTRYDRIRLDPHGAFVWRQSTGDLTVEQIANEFRARFPDQDQPLERCCKFVNQLALWRLIRLE